MHVHVLISPMRCCVCRCRVPGLGAHPTTHLPLSFSFDELGKLTLLSFPLSCTRYVALLPAPGHHQGPHAALAVRPSPRCTSSPSLSSFLSFPNSKLTHCNPHQTKARGFIATGAMIVRRETPLALYKGLGAVLSGIVPKMSVRFASFETYKGWLADKETGKTSLGSIFLGASTSCYACVFGGE